MIRGSLEKVQSAVEGAEPAWYALALAPPCSSWVPGALAVSLLLLEGSMVLSHSAPGRHCHGCGQSQQLAPLRVVQAKLPPHPCAPELYGDIVHIPKAHPFTGDNSRVLVHFQSCAAITTDNLRMFSSLQKQPPFP